MEDDSVSAARRRRERRLRQFLRHERLSVAMTLSEKKHHTSPSQRKEGGWYEKYYTAMIRNNFFPAGVLPAVRGRVPPFPATLSG